MKKPQGTSLTNLFPQFPKITLVSDTHNLHENLKLGKGDLLIHSGDCSDYGTSYEIKEFLKWFVKQEYTHKILIAGNHDFYFEEVSKSVIKKQLPKNLIYLQDESISIEGVKIYGSPVTPYFFGMAFNKMRGEEIREIWQGIPTDIDILITHGPPYGILDNGLGCEELRKYVDQIQPILHAFGHIHEAKGVLQKHSTTYVNSSEANYLF